MLFASRAVHYAAGLQLFGIACFQALLAPTALRDAIGRPCRVVAWISAALLLCSALVWLPAQAGRMGDGFSDAFDPQVVGTVLSATSFGRVWTWHLLFCLLALASLLRPGWRVLLLFSTLALATLGLVGHAATETGLVGLLNRASQVLHLLSSGFWLGALAPLLFSLREMVLPDRGHHAALALRRFSGLGHFAVAAVLASGVSNSWFVLQGAALDAGSTYQRLLAAKVLIALTMVGLAVVNRYVFVPRIPNGGPGARQLAHGTIAEVVLSAALLAIVALLGMLSPHA